MDEKQLAKLSSALQRIAESKNGNVSELERILCREMRKLVEEIKNGTIAAEDVKLHMEQLQTYAGEGENGKAVWQRASRRFWRLYPQ